MEDNDQSSQNLANLLSDFVNAVSISNSNSTSNSESASGVISIGNIQQYLNDNPFPEEINFGSEQQENNSENMFVDGMPSLESDYSSEEEEDIHQIGEQPYTGPYVAPVEQNFPPSNDWGEDNYEDEDDYDSEEEMIIQPQQNADPYQQFFPNGYGSQRACTFFANVRQRVLTGINTDTWLAKETMSNIPCEDEEMQESLDIAKTQNLTTMFEHIGHIFSVIPEEIRDNRINRYIIETGIHLNGVLNFISTFDILEFSSSELFLWIALMEACRKEAKVIEYLVNSPYFKPEIFNKKGYAGMDCLRMACMSDTSESLEKLIELNLINMSDLHDFDEKGYTPIMWAAAFSPSVTKTIIEFQLVSKENFWKGVNNTDADPFMIACELGSMSAIAILNSEYMEEQYFTKDYYNGYTCLMAATPINDRVTEEILKHELCTPEFMARVDTKKHMNVFNIACTNNVDSVKAILQSGKMTSEIFKNKFKMGYDPGTTRNIFHSEYVTSKSDLYSILFESEYFDSNMLVDTNGGVQPAVFSPYKDFTSAAMYKLSDEQLNVEYHNYNILTYAIANKFESISAILSHPKLTEEMFNSKLNNNGIITLMGTAANRRNIRYNQCQATVWDSLFECRFFTVEYIKNNVEEFVNKLADNMFTNKLASSPLLTTELCNVPYLNSTLVHYMVQHNNLAKSLFENGVITTDMLIEKNNGVPLVHTIARIGTPMTYLLASKTATPEVLNCLDGENTILHTIAESSIENNDISVVVELLTHPNCSKEIVNKKNADSLSPFLLAFHNNIIIANIIQKSDKYEKTVEFNPEEGMKILMSSINKKELAGVELAISLVNITPEMLKKQNSDGETCFFRAAESSLEIFKLLTGLEHFDRNMLDIKSTSHNRTCFNVAVKNCTDIAKYMLESGYVTKEIFDTPDSEGYNSFMVSCLAENTLLNDMFKSDMLTKETLEQKAEGRTIFGLGVKQHVLARIFNLNCFTPDFMKEEYELESGDKYNPYQLLIARRFEDVLKIFFDRNDTKEFMGMTDYGGNSIVHNLANFNEDFARYIVENKFMDSNIMSSMNKNGATCLNYLMNISPDYCNIVISSQNCSPELLNTSVENIIKMEIEEYENITEEGCNVFMNLILDNRINKDHIKKLMISNGFLTKIITLNFSAIKDFLKTEYMCVELVESTYEDLNVFGTLMAFISDSDHYRNIFRELLEKFPSAKALNHPQGTFPILYPLSVSSCIQDIFASNIDISPSIAQIVADGKMRDFILSMMSYNMDNLLSFSNSQYFSEDYLLDSKTDKNQHASIAYLSEVSEDNFKKFINCPKLFTDKVRMYGDIDNDTFLIFLSRSSKLLKILVDEGQLTREMVENTNNYGQDVYLYLASNEFYEQLEILFNDKMPNLLKTDYSGFSILDGVMKSRRLSEMCINLGIITKDLLMANDQNGTPYILKAIEYQSDITDYAFENDIMDEDLISVKCHNKENCLMKAIRYYPSIVNKILGSKHFAPSLLHDRNRNRDTPLMYACRWNDKIVPTLLSHPETTTDDFFRGHMDKGSCLTYSAQFHPEAVKYILASDLLTWKIFATTHNKLNFLQIGAIYNSSVMKYAVESSWDLMELISSYIPDDNYSEFTEPVFVLAAKYQPDGFATLLESKYATMDTLAVKSSDDKVFIHYALESQPKSLYYAIKSENPVVKEFLDIPYDSGYTVYNALKKSFPQITSLEDAIESISLLSERDTPCADTNPMCCPICYASLKKVALMPCMHTYCTACSLKLRECSSCRTVIQDRKIVF